MYKNNSNVMHTNAKNVHAILQYFLQNASHNNRSSTVCNKSAVPTLIQKWLRLFSYPDVSSKIHAPVLSSRRVLPKFLVSYIFHPIKVSYTCPGSKYVTPISPSKMNFMNSLTPKSQHIKTNICIDKLKKKVAS